MKRTMLVAALALAACAPEVVRHPVTVVETRAPAQLTTDAAIAFSLDSGYGRSIAAGVQFAEVGEIPQGRVLRPTNTVITVEGSHVHEAYPVVRDGRLVGFYLPVERSFSPLSAPVPIQLSHRKAS